MKACPPPTAPATSQCPSLTLDFHNFFFLNKSLDICFVFPLLFVVLRIGAPDVWRLQNVALKELGAEVFSVKQSGEG